MSSFRQQDSNDCGVACLRYVFDRHKVAVSAAVLRQKSGTDRSGATALGLVETATQCGFNAKGIRGDWETLRLVEKPTIAHLVLDDQRQHYVVVCSVDRNSVKVMDPAVGRVSKWSAADFRKAWSGVLVMVVPGAAAGEVAPALSGARRLARLVLARRGAVIEAVVGAFVGTALSLSTTIYVQKLIDNVIGDGNAHLLTLLGLAMLGIIAVRALVTFCQAHIQLRAGQQVDATLMVGYYRHLLRLPQSFFETTRIGEITARLGDAARIRAFLNATIVTLLLNPMTAGLALLAMFFYSWKLAALSLALLPLNAGLYLLADWRNRRFQREVMERSSAFNAQFVEAVSAHQLVRAFSLGSRLADRIDEKFAAFLGSSWDASRLGSALSVVGTCLTQCYSVALLWFGASEVLHAQLTAGELMSCYALSSYFSTPLLSLIGVNSAIQEAVIATERLYEIIDVERERDEGSIELSSERTMDVRVESVGFKYPGRLPILQSVSHTFRSGTITALVGGSGSGKSTLLALLHRVYRPDRGRIRIGEHDLGQIRLESLRRYVAFVPQKSELLAGSLLENIAPGVPDPDVGRVTKIIDDLRLTDFVDALPQGLHSKVSEAGANISGGQRQRIAIARALYLGSPVLIMDEPTAALDASAQQALLKVLANLRDQGRIVIMATHAAGVLEVADETLVLERGIVRAVPKPSAPPLLAPLSFGAGARCATTN